MSQYEEIEAQGILVNSEFKVVTNPTKKKQPQKQPPKS